MFKIRLWLEHIWWQKTPPPRWLRCLEPIYSAISQAHLNNRAGKAIAPPLPMISVGNITAGGSGKTPFVLWLAEQLKNKGYKPIILCRGDGGKNTSPRLIHASDKASTVGDEAKMLADLSACPVIAAADRIAGSHKAAGLGDILILDDGFQYRHLQRCCDIVLVPAAGTGNGHMIPAGPLREAITTLARADIVIRTASTSNGTSSNRTSNTTTCQALSHQPEWQWHTTALELIDIMHTGAVIPTSVHAVTAIARPQRFFDDLKASGLHLIDSQTYPDHHRFTEKEVQQLLHKQSAITVTAKDAVKLQALWPKDRPLWVLHLQGQADNPRLFETIQSYLPKISSET